MCRYHRGVYVHILYATSHKPYITALLTLGGAHAQLGLRYLVRECVCVCVSVRSSFSATMRNKTTK